MSPEVATPPSGEDGFETSTAAARASGGPRRLDLTPALSLNIEPAFQKARELLETGNESVVRTMRNFLEAVQEGPVNSNAAYMYTLQVLEFHAAMQLAPTRSPATQLAPTRLACNAPTTPDRPHDPSCDASSLELQYRDPESTGPQGTDALLRVAAACESAKAPENLVKSIRMRVGNNGEPFDKSSWSVIRSSLEAHFKAEAHINASPTPAATAPSHAPSSPRSPARLRRACSPAKSADKRKRDSAF